ncbi:MAG: hypothetical protein AAFV47_10265 [Pseudomonadota bacterium]
MPIHRNQHLRTILALAGLSTIVGCASVERTVTEDGSEVFAVICDGNSRGANFCLEKAGRTCAARNGYKILSNDGRVAEGLDKAALADLSAYMDFASDRNRLVFVCNDDE